MLNVGDKVRFKTWDHMVEKYGYDEEYERYININDYYFFIPEMAYLCGKSDTITEIEDGIIMLKDNNIKWTITEEMLEKI